MADFPGVNNANSHSSVAVTQDLTVSSADTVRVQVPRVVLPAQSIASHSLSLARFRARELQLDNSLAGLRSRAYSYSEFIAELKTWVQHYPIGLALTEPELAAERDRNRILSTQLEIAVKGLLAEADDLLRRNHTLHRDLLLWQRSNHRV